MGGRTRRRHPAPVSQKLGRLGERIRAARQEAGLSQSQLGAPHFTRAYVSALERGKIRPSMKSLEFLSDRLGKPVSLFMEDPGESKRKREREFEMLRAKDLIARGRASEAVSIVQVLLEQPSPSLDRLETQRLLARALVEARAPAKALPYLEAARRIADASHKKDSIAMIERQLAHAYYELRDLSEAERHVTLALEMARGGVIRDPLFLVHALQLRGTIQLLAGRRREAVLSLEEALELGKDVGDPKWLASVYAALGTAYQMDGDLEGAIGWMTKGVVLLEEMQNIALAADIRLNLAAALGELGHVGQAKSVLEKALEDASRLKRTATAAGCLVSLSVVAKSRGDEGEARELAERAVQVGRESGDVWILSQALANAARLATSTEMADLGYQEAIELAERSNLGNLQELYGGYAKLLEDRGAEMEAGLWARKALHASTRRQSRRT